MRLLKRLEKSRSNIEYRGRDKQMDEWYLEPISMIVFGLAAIVAILIVWMAMIGSRFKRLRRKYDEAMGHAGNGNVEDILIELRRQMEVHDDKAEHLRRQMAAIEAKLPQMKSKVGIVRYNAFSDGGSDLSFSVAIVNDELDGIVFSGLHSRESTYVYAKPVDKGNSAYPLTPEELKAIGSAK